MTVEETARALEKALTGKVNQSVIDREFARVKANLSNAAFYKREWLDRRIAEILKEHGGKYG